MYMYEYITSAFNSFCGPQKCVIFLGNREMSSSTWFRIWNDNAKNIFPWEGVVIAQAIQHQGHKCS